MLEFTPQVCERLKQKRLELRISYCTLGHFLGVSWATVRKWELGKTAVCQHRYSQRVRKFLNGDYDEDFERSTTYQAPASSLRPISPAAVACIRKLASCYRLLSSRPDLQKELLTEASLAVSRVLRQLAGPWKPIFTFQEPSSRGVS
ncbi:MAG: hypothetical protein MJ202_05005 [Lentisphaeria bacterium]|nr:hypothetical protein [Lentisphaeria bacterium]